MDVRVAAAASDDDEEEKEEKGDAKPAAKDKAKEEESQEKEKEGSEPVAGERGRGGVPWCLTRVVACSCSSVIDGERVDLPTRSVPPCLVCGALGAGRGRWLRRLCQRWLARSPYLQSVEFKHEAGGAPQATVILQARSHSRANFSGVGPAATCDVFAGGR